VPVTHHDSEGGDYSSIDAKLRCEREALPWAVSLSMDPDHMRNGQIVSEFLKVVNNIQGVGNHQDLLFTLLTELYNNALDHGLLKLDSSLKQDPEGFAEYYQLRTERLTKLDEGEILFEFKVVPATTEQAASLTFRLTDTGDGFDISAKTEPNEEDDLSFGRGMDMVRSMCHSVEYSNQGRTVEVSYLLQ